MAILQEFSDYFDLLRRRALYFLLPFAAVAAASIAIVMSLPAIYESRAKIIVESQQIPSDLVKSTITSIASERLQVIEQRVMTRDNILQIVDKFGLFKDQPGLSKSELVALAASRIKIAQSDFAVPNQRRRENLLTIAFSISYEDERPDLAARVANELVTLVLNEDARSRTSRAVETSNFLEKESKRLAAELAAAEAQIGEFKLKNSLALPEKLQFNMALLEKTEKSAAEAERDMQAIEEEKRLLAFEANVKSAAAGSPLGSGGRAEFEKKVALLRSELASKSAIYAESHPEMRARRLELKSLEAELAAYQEPPEDAAGAAPTASNFESQMVAEKVKTLEERKIYLQAQREKYSAAAEDLKAIIVQTPEVGSALSALDRNRESLQKRLEEIGSKFAQAKLGERLEEDQQAERFEVIEQPILPQAPSRPERFKLATLGLAIAAAIGGGVAFAAESFDSTIRTSKALEGLVGSRPIVAIPYITSKRESRSVRLKAMAFAAIAMALLLCVLLAVHFLYMPLDLLFYKLVDRLPL